MWIDHERYCCFLAIAYWHGCQNTFTASVMWPCYSVITWGERELLNNPTVVTTQRVRWGSAKPQDFSLDHVNTDWWLFLQKIQQNLNDPLLNAIIYERKCVFYWCVVIKDGLGFIRHVPNPQWTGSCTVLVSFFTLKPNTLQTKPFLQKKLSHLLIAKSLPEGKVYVLSMDVSRLANVGFIPLNRVCLHLNGKSNVFFRLGSFQHMCSKVYHWPISQMQELDYCFKKKPQ